MTEKGIHLGALTSLMDLLAQARRKTFTEAMAQEEEQLLLIDDLVRMGLLWRLETHEFGTSAREALLRNRRNSYFLTPFGYRFVMACRRAPAPAEVDDSLIVTQ
jgi:hypothetical protein